MKILRAPMFIICCILFVLHQLFQKIFKIAIPLADQYLDNLLITPILLTLLVVERRLLFKRGAQYYLTLLEVTIATLFIAIVCEIVFPILSKDFVTDWRDTIFYFLGSLIFYRFINQWPEKNARSKI